MHDNLFVFMVWLAGGFCGAFSVIVGSHITKRHQAAAAQKAKLSRWYVYDRDLMHIMLILFNDGFDEFCEIVDLNQYLRPTNESPFPRSSEHYRMRYNRAERLKDMFLFAQQNVGVYHTVEKLWTSHPYANYIVEMFLIGNSHDMREEMKTWVWDAVFYELQRMARDYVPSDENQPPLLTDMVDMRLYAVYQAFHDNRDDIMRAIQEHE